MKTARLIAGGIGLPTLALIAAACTTPTSNNAEVAEQAPVAAAIAPKVQIVPRAGTERLARAEHPFAKPELDRGRVEGSRRIANLSLVLRPSAEQLKDRQALADAQLDPKSPSFHKWLDPEGYRARFGARKEDLARAAEWLAAQGFEVHRTSRLGNRITFSATVADLEKGFQTEMHRYEVGGKTHFAMALAPAMPTDLARLALGIRNTHDFFPKPLYAKNLSAGMAERAANGGGPDYTLRFPHSDASTEVLGPPDWATAYDVAKLYSPGIGGKKLDGTGITIGIVGTAQIAQSDIDAFRTTFNLPQRTVTMTVVPDTGPAAPGQQGSGSEAILDVEWSGGVAKGADVNYVYIGADDGNVDDATIYIIEENLAPVISESYGGCEFMLTPADADMTEEYGTAANIMGITYMAAAGDSGADGCLDFGLLGLYGSTPGTFPGVTSVGGTQFPDPTWSAGGDLTATGVEQVWNEANNPFLTVSYMGYTFQPGVGAGGGGLSSVFARPLYQKDVKACDIIGSLPVATSTPMRQTPDVSFSAASGTPGYFVECTFDNTTQDCSATGGRPFGTPIGGTSASSPSFAGLVAILNQAVGERLGNINPMLYALAAAGKSPSPFNDITQGSNAVVCGAAANDGGTPEGGFPDSGCAESGLQGYNAAVGYDCASGIGSVDGYNLVNAWLGRAKTSTVVVPSPSSISEGAKVTLTATVTVDTTNANDVGGDVTFAFESFDATGALDQTWELGSAALTNGTATSGTVTLTTTVPPGLVIPGHQSVDVIAVYGGDVNHLASQSAATVLQFAPIHFTIAPETSQLVPNASEQFHATGGVHPIQWFIGNVDTTLEFSDAGQYIGSSQIDQNSGLFVAGPIDGYTEVLAVDKDGAEALAYVTVGTPTVPPPWASDAGVDSGARDAGKRDASSPDAGHDAGPAREDASAHDAGVDVAQAKDAGVDSARPVKDAGHAHDAVVDALAHEDAGTAPGGSSGCGCEVAKGRTSPNAPLGGAFGVAIGLALVARRRRGR